MKTNMATMTTKLMLAYDAVSAADVVFAADVAISAADRDDDGDYDHKCDNVDAYDDAVD